jgi:UDP-N-acetyl-D-glucosamine dehydrogenase
MKSLIEKINDHSAVVGIMGLGYVGLPLAMAFAKHFPVIGYDVSERTINTLKSGLSHIQDVPASVVQNCLDSTFYPTNNSDYLRQCDFFIMCVPTPLNEEHEPDLKYVISATKTVAAQLRKDQFVILESTTYPGTTDDVMAPILEASGLKAGKDFGLAHSPERIDPGNTSAVEDIPKVVGGITPECTEIAVALYSSVLKHIVPVADARTAEAVKILENTYRYINIGMINELAMLFDKLGISIWDTADAAATKPYGFMKFTPGPGLGGHCIPLDPHYLEAIALQIGFVPRFISLAGEVNHQMKIYTVSLAKDALASAGKQIRNANITVFGLAYKKNIDDARETPATYIIESLQSLGANVTISDPYVKSFKTKNGELEIEHNIETALKDCDCAVFLVDHDPYTTINQDTIKSLMKQPIVVDCKNIFKNHNDLMYHGLGTGHV